MIRMDGRVLAALEGLRIHPRETLDDLLERLFEEAQSAGGKAGMDVERFIEMLAEGKTGFDAEREILAST